MGVINKLKGRMSGYNALTKGPAKFDDFGFDPGNERSSATDAVSAGLKAGAAQQAPVEEDFGAKLAEVGANLGAAIGSSGMLSNADKNSKMRKEAIKANKESGMSGKEARKAFRAKKDLMKDMEKNPFSYINIV